MKKASLFILFALFALLSSSCVITNGPKEKYTQSPDDGKTYDVKSFSAIKATGVFNLIFSQGDKESVVVKGYLPKGLAIKNDGDTLVITDTLDWHHHDNVNIKTDIYVTLKNVNKITVESVGITSCADTLKLKSLVFHADGVGATGLWLNTEHFEGTEEGVGKLTIAGRASYAKIEDDGIGALDASAFKVDELHVNVTGVGAAKVYAVKEIYLQSSGVGGVKYSGPAKVMQNMSSGLGKVEHAD